MADDTAIFPYFGRKAQIAHVVWQALGDVNMYIEPFAGALGVMLNRPHAPRFEIVNDLDCWIANFWRSCAYDSESVAEHADWPQNESDYHARLAWFKAHRKEWQAKIEGDPKFYDTEVAGWWAWGQSTAILGSWPRACGIQIGLKCGVHARNGVERVRALQARMRHVTVMCGDFIKPLKATWDRCGVVGVFLDPPYVSARTPGMYDGECDDGSAVVPRVNEWCLAHPEVRTVVCGLAGEYPDLEAAGWRVVPWRTRGGLDKTGKRENRLGPANRGNERLWLSPTCLAPTAQVGLPGVE